VNEEKKYSFTEIIHNEDEKATSSDFWAVCSSQSVFKMLSISFTINNSMNGITDELQCEFHHWESILSDPLRSINMRGNLNIIIKYIGIL
jgi:hypothetical protein